MRRNLYSALLTVVGLTGCISISTHEKMMKQYRDAQQELSQLRSEKHEWEKKKGELEEELSESIMDKERLKAKISEVRTAYDELVESLKDDIAKGNVGLENPEGGLTITMGSGVLFGSGSAILQPEGKKILIAVARSLKKVTDNYVQIEGHSDSIPITGALKSRYPSNWDLSAARASSVVQYLQEAGGVDPSLLILSAFAEHRPIGDNKTRSGREQNRRVKITLLPKNQ